MILRLTFLIGSFNLMAVCANAQSLQGADDNYDRVLSAQRAEIAMYNYSKCLINNKKREKLVSEFLLIPDNHPDQSNVNKKLIVAHCAQDGSEMRFQGELFRRSLYTALYVKYFRKTIPSDIKTDFEFDYTNETSAKYDKIDGAQLVLRKISDCAIRNNPVAAHKFAIAKLHSKTEKELISPVVAALGNCLPTDAKLEFSRTNLKGQLAEGLYKLRTIPAANPQEISE